MARTSHPARVSGFVRHLPNLAKLYWRLFLDGRVRLRAKSILVVAAIYLVSPLDLVPNLVFPFVGLVDDAVVAWVALRWFIASCPGAVLDEHVRRIDAEARRGG